MEATNSTSPNLSCDDVMILLKNMRAIDDRIIYQLNLATPTESFRKEVNPTENCKSLYNQLNTTYGDRNKLINRCLIEFTDSVKSLKAQEVKDKDNYKLVRKIRSAQSKARELQSELTIEEIIRQRSLKAFDENCKLYFKPNITRETT